MWVLYAVLTILLAYQYAVYAHSYVYITSSTHIVSYSIKSQSSELVHSFTDLLDFLRPEIVAGAHIKPMSQKVYEICLIGKLAAFDKFPHVLNSGTRSESLVSQSSLRSLTMAANNEAIIALVIDAIGKTVSESGGSLASTSRYPKLARYISFP